jgi:hypothetical protein
MGEGLKFALSHDEEFQSLVLRKTELSKLHLTITEQDTTEKQKLPCGAWELLLFFNEKLCCSGNWFSKT